MEKYLLLILFQFVFIGPVNSQGSEALVRDYNDPPKLNISRAKDYLFVSLIQNESERDEWIACDPFIQINIYDNEGSIVSTLYGIDVKTFYKENDRKLLSFSIMVIDGFSVEMIVDPLKDCSIFPESSGEYKYWLLKNADIESFVWPTNH